MREPIDLSMSLEVGFETGDLSEIEPLIGDALNVDLRFEEEDEHGLGFAYEPRPRPTAGLEAVNSRPNKYYYHPHGTFFHHPEVKHLLHAVKVWLVGTDLLELGRVADRFAEVGAPRVIRYSVSELLRDRARRDYQSEFWRDHLRYFVSDDDALPQWDRGFESGEPATLASSEGVSLEAVLGERPPALTCQLTFGFETPDPARAVEVAGAALGARFEQREAKISAGSANTRGRTRRRGKCRPSA